MDPDQIAEKAVQRGIISSDNVSRMSTAEKRNLALMPGFSTADEVSEISGRGVGMDVVKTNIEKLGGYLEIDSEKGKGTTIRIRLPLTLAIIPSLIVGAGGQKFAIPQINIKELVCIRAKDAPFQTEAVAGAEVLRLRGNLLPVARLADILDLERSFVHFKTGKKMADRRQRLVDRRNQTESPMDDAPQDPVSERRNSQERRQSWHSDLYVVVLRIGDNLFGLCVEELFDTEEIVVKPLSDHLKNAKCFAGATIMGDGRVAMILDAQGIADHQSLRFLEVSSEIKRRHEEEASRKPVDKGENLSILLFKNAPDEQFAVSLDDIARIEKIDPQGLHHVGGRDFMNFRGESLPLIRLEDYLGVSPLTTDRKGLFVIVPKGVPPVAGILVSEILDAVEVTLVIKEQHRQPGIRGSAFIGGQLTLFLDTGELLGALEDAGGTHSARKVEAA
jgi:two-component system chemotaxis sensor kinase CheA